MIPKVSIIIPVYNGENYLCECLDSVINQTLKEIEIICVNDGSVDMSVEILGEYAQKDNRIKIISKPNSGMGHTMNVGINAASGEFVGIVESDDFVSLQMFEKLYETAKEYDLDFVKSDFYRFTGEQKDRKVQLSRLLEPSEDYYCRIIDPQNEPSLLGKLRSISNWAGIYSKNYLINNQILHNETPGASYQDTGFLFQVFCLARKIFLMDEAFYYYRNDNPNSSINNKQKVFCLNDEYDFILRFLNKDKKRSERFIKYYSLRKFHGYMFTYKRIGDEFKREFLKRFSDEFNYAIKEGEVDQNIFTQTSWNTLMEIVRDPDKYYLRQQEKITHPELQDSQTQSQKPNIRLLKIGKTLFKKFGLFILWLPRVFIKKIVRKVD